MGWLFGAGLGWFMGGPLGAIIGAALQNALSQGEYSKIEHNGQATNQEIGRASCRERVLFAV